MNDKAGPEPMSVTMSFKLTPTLRDAIFDEAVRQGMHVSELMRTVLSGFLAHIDKENE